MMKSQNELDETGNEPRAPERNSTAGAPRWAKILGLIAIIFLVVVVIVHLTTGGFMHHTPPSNGREHATQP